MSHAAALVLPLLLSTAPPASAQASPLPAITGTSEGHVDAAAALPTTIGATDGLRERVGLEAATRLTRSADASERLRGLERAAAMRTTESLSLLAWAAESSGVANLDPRRPPEGFARTDPRALLVVVRGLAAWIDQEKARSALAAIVAAPAASFAPRVASAPSSDPAFDESEGLGRILLARREAALALAGSGSGLVVEALVTLARSGGPGQGPALDALAALPPTAPSVFAGVALTTPAMIALAAEVADLRTLDAVLGVVHSSDPSLRAAAIAALGVFGDTRGIDVARAAVHDSEARVRIAAADALVHFGAPDAAKTVEALVQDDRTAAAGLALAERVSDDGVAKAAAARALASADASLRQAAVVALGRQAGPLAVGALAALAADPALEASVANALARSPSHAAMGAIEALAALGASRRLAARAYFVRLSMRAERSAKLDALMSALAESSDPRDRAVATEAAVALGEMPLLHGLEDRDPRVRRAAAMGAMARADARTNAVLVDHIAAEPDEATRITLCAGLVDGDPTAILSTSDLTERVSRGGADAPLAALALSRRAEQGPVAALDTLLASPDPVFRAHAARGLGSSGAPDAIGRLVRLYLWEADVDVRRAVVQALGAAAASLSALGRETLTLAASLDPDAITREAAERALGGVRSAKIPSIREVAWIKLAPAEMAVVPKNETAVLIRSDGLAVPIAFDDDGYALVPGVPPGNARLRLAPRLPTYFPSAP